jgi:hypothetical protein
VEVEGRQPVELLVGELAEVDLEWAFCPLRRCEVGDVAGVAEGDLFPEATLEARRWVGRMAKRFAF